jgi:hypothetical protein
MTSDRAATTDKWQSFGRVLLHAADAVECGWSRALAEQSLAALLPSRDVLSAAEARVALDAARANGGAPASAALALAAQIAEEILDYRIERARVAAAYQPIRHAKVNIKKLLKSQDVKVEQLRVLADELGWTVREDEEGVTVPVDELIPFFRRPVVRQLLDAKMKQVGLAATAT